jgi:hypothetical protein
MREIILRDVPKFIVTARAETRVSLKNALHVGLTTARRASHGGESERNGECV